MLRRLLALSLLTAPLAAQAPLPTPEQALGFGIGADYRLATYSQLHRWWEQLAAASPRMVLDTIGTTAEGRPQVMAILSSPANIARREHYRQISERLARGRVDSATARSLADSGKAIIWIDGGLHATEVLGATQLMELVWQFVTRDDAETRRILDDVIILAVHANPDGMELVSSWYMREADTLQRSLNGLPVLYQKYVGHDNNRDLYRNAQAESRNMSRVMYTEWYPQIMYNHHQTGPAGSVMFAPPFRDPFNYVYDPMLVTGLDFVGDAMHRRFTAEGKGGTVSRDAASYSTWWNGGLRTTAYFHNIIGLLTETIGSPTPMQVPLRLERQLPSSGQALPVAWGEWRFRQSVDYSMTANRAVLDLASRYRESLLFNLWQMGANAIARGRTDTWTHDPTLIDAARAAAEGKSGREATAAMEAVLRDPARRDPYAYLIPADQPEIGNALDFLDAMRISGIEIWRATAAFEHEGTRYAAGTFVIPAAQAFRPHVLDMFEPQDHPTDLQYPGGPPKAPYDNAGWTMAMQMGFRFDRAMSEVTGPLEEVTALHVTPRPVAFDRGAGAWIVSPASTDAFRAVNAVAAAGGRVERLPNGDFVLRGGRTAEVLAGLARERALATQPARGARGTAVRPLRVGLWDRYGGSMPSGWTRWIFEQYGVPFEVVYPQRLDAGDLARDFDVLVFVDGAIPPAGGRGGRFGGGGGGNDRLPEEYRDRTGSITAETTIPALRAFVEGGGRIITIGSSTALVDHFGLPVTNHLVERQPDGSDQRLSRDKYYVPGSLLEVTVNPRVAVSAGADSTATVMFDNSPVFSLPPDAAARGIRPVAWFGSATPLRSGWAYGQGYLENGVTMFEADLGKGRLYAYGPEVLFRAQPEGTYRFVFNALID
ncbi:MAG: M14 family zinc carboxypeptidase [Gemmatimonadales bacterium]|nr:peptidase [Gemmatimonadota bacterium]MCB9505169.1 peptidase [Gemmatimonadales bacterium]